MGFSQHAGMAICCDGSIEADRRLARVLWNDPASGVMRHADAGYPIARDCAVRAKTGRLFPYRGWLRWHHGLGVFTGLFVFTWMLSGWLSMDHGRLLSVPTPRAEQIDRLRNSRLPESAVRLILDDKASTWVHVDAATGRILSIMDRRRRLNRWLFNGLHSLDFPGFTERRPLWDLVILALLALGLGFSVTGVYLAYARLRRPRRIIRRETQ